MHLSPFFGIKVFKVAVEEIEKLTFSIFVSGTLSFVVTWPEKLEAKVAKMLFVIGPFLEHLELN